jgi:hypothetical protein
MGCKNKQEIQYYQLWAMNKIIKEIFDKLSRAFQFYFLKERERK